MTESPPIVLTSGQSRCAVYPSMGGSLGAWSFAGQDMVRPIDPAAIDRGDPRDAAAFPLTPYSNRIGRGAFVWEGRAVGLALNAAPEPHALHGVGWRRPWRAEAVSPSAATLVFDHRPDANWPWPFEARQTFALAENRLTVALSATNLAHVATPLAVGFHPYFHQAGARLCFEADAIWLPGPDGLPQTSATPAGRFDFRAPAMVAGRDIDHCYGDWTGVARIDWQGLPFALTITADPVLAAAVVYIPPGGDAFCFEPVPHVSNALNLPGATPAMPVVAPGETFSATIMFEAVS